jgi:hypothetical protein
MSRYEDSTGPGIGATLKDARRRLGIDIREAEARTKIRTRYLRALEAEDWEVLPAPAYVRGFLRVYGQILGLDGEVLADRYRRSYEEPVAVASAAAEPVLSKRRSPGTRPSSRSGLILIAGGAVVILLVVLAILGLTSGDGDGPSPGAGKKGNPEGRGGGQHKADRKGDGSNQGREPVDLSIDPLSTVRICLVGDSRNALIDSQVLTAGATEQFSGEKTYRLDLVGGGTVKLQVGDEGQKLEAPDNASYEADSKGISEISYAGPNCP